MPSGSSCLLALSESHSLTSAVFSALSARLYRSLPYLLSMRLSSRSLTCLHMYSLLLSPLTFPFSLSPLTFPFSLSPSLSTSLISPTAKTSNAFTGFIVDANTPGITLGRKENNLGQKYEVLRNYACVCILVFICECVSMWDKFHGCFRLVTRATIQYCSLFFFSLSLF